MGDYIFNGALYLIAISFLIFSFVKDKKKTKTALLKAWKSFENILPMLLGIIIIVGILIAEANLRPLVELKQTKVVRIIKGTSLHEFGEGSSSITIDKLLRNSYPNKDIKSLYHGLLTIGDFTIDYSHHGASAGRRDWLKGNEARFYLRNIMYSEIKLGNKPANLYLRAHYHEPLVEWLSMGMLEEEYESWFCILPSLCMIDDYARKVTSSKFIVTNGIYTFEIINDALYKIHKFKKTLDIRTKEEIE